MKKSPFLFGIFLALLGTFCTQPGEEKPTANDDIDGAQLAQLFCVSCHQFPEPSMLDKATWKNYVLVRMAAFMGIYEDNVQYFDQMPKQWMEPGIGGQRVRKARVYPEKPTMSREDWEKIKKYYLDQAPEKLPPASDGKNITVGIPFFDSQIFSKEKKLSALVQGIGIDEERQQVYAAIYEGGIFEMDFTGKVKNYHPGKSFIAQIEVDRQGFSTLDMGTRLASDHPKGILQSSNSWEDWRRKKVNTTLQPLMRPVHFSKADLNGDQREDYLISEYGNLLGQLAWYEAKDNGTFAPHPLFKDDGAIRTEILDFNRDELPDILALQANADEGIDLYLNRGEGQFSRERKLRFPPSYGSTHFMTTDFNQDGAPDLLVCHGDNGDYPPILKPYHGIRLYLQNLEQGTFEESFFLPQNGAYQATAQDFDLDGDLDIAAVSFHPDFTGRPQESFILWVNDGANEFTPFTIPQYANARWMRFACTDIDGDQDLDILLTAFNIKTPEIPAALAQHWAEADEAILLLENKTR